LMFVVFLLSMKHQVASKNKKWLDRGEDNMSKWGYMSICGLLLQ
jgi:hypothetical protein